MKISELAAGMLLSFFESDGGILSITRYSIKSMFTLCRL